jgi:hypothetical protein
VALPLSGTGLGETVGVKLGAVASRRTTTFLEAVPPLLVASQISGMRSVSVVTTVG